MMTLDELKWFVARVELQDSGCWHWLGKPNPDGYGQCNFRGQRTSAHRASYTIFQSEIPNGLVVRHICHNRCCVNPAHLELGTKWDNTMDMIHAGRNDYRSRGLKPLTDDEINLTKSTVQLC